MSLRRKRGRGKALRIAAAAALCVGLFGVAPPVRAQSEAPAPVVDLDKLRQLPTSLDLEPAARGSATKAEWRERFDTARSELAAAQAALAKSKAKIAELPGTGSAWQLAAPGIGGSDPGQGTRDAPLDYSLSAELRRNREELDRCERRLTELEIEANLAGVPQDWRGAQAADAATATRTDATRTEGTQTEEE